MTEGSDGNFYGTTYGAYAGFGSVFSVTPGGVFTNLFFFNNTNGSHPVGVLVHGADGNFYGTTSEGARMVWERLPAQRAIASRDQGADTDKWDGDTHLERGSGTNVSSAILG